MLNLFSKVYFYTKACWMKDEGYKIRDEYGVYYLTFTVVEWIDVFSRKIYIDIVLDSLKFCIEKKQLKLFAWCIMTNHIHLIVQSSKGDLSGTLRDFKKFTSSRIINAIVENKEESRRNWMLWIFKKAGEKNSRNKDYQFWQQENPSCSVKHYTFYFRETKLYSQQLCKSRNS